MNKLIGKFDNEGTLKDIQDLWGRVKKQYELHDEIKNTIPRDPVGDYYYVVEETSPSGRKTIVNHEIFKTERERTVAANRQEQSKKSNQKIIKGSTDSTLKFNEKSHDNEYASIVRRMKHDKTPSDVFASIVKNIDTLSKHSAENIYLYNAKEYVKKIKHDGKHPQEAVDMEKLIEHIENERQDVSLEGRMKSFAKKTNTFIFLGGSIATAIMNLTSIPMAVVPYLIHVGGIKNFPKSLHLAGNLLLESGDNFANLLSKSSMFKGYENEAKILGQKLIRTGTLEEIDLNTMRSIFNNGLFPSFSQNFKTGVFNGVMLPFKYAEMLNRRVTAIALLKTAIENKQKLGLKNDTDILNFVRNGIDATQGAYTKENKPSWARSPIGELLYAFKTYPITQLQTFLQYAKVDKKTAGLMALMILGVVGEQGFFMSEDLEDVIDTMGKAAGYNTNSKKWKEEFLTSTLGEQGKEFVMYGMMGALGMAGAGARMSLGNMVPSTDIFDPTNNNKTKSLIELAGPTGSYVKSAFDATQMAMGGDINKALLNISPNFIKNMVTAVKASNDGYFKNRENKKIGDADSVEIFGKFFGFQPNDIAVYYREVAKIRSDADMVNYMKKLVNDKMVKAIINEDENEQKEVVAYLQEWNKNNKDNIEMQIGLNRASIRKKIIALKSSPEMNDIKSLPKQLRSKAYQKLIQLQSEE
jgi:hypothetical protein